MIQTTTPPGPARPTERRVTLLRSMLITVIGIQLTGCATIPRDQLAEEQPFRAKYSPRWETNETPYEEAAFHDKMGRNIRDGFVGIMSDFVAGGFSLATIGPYTGYVVQKTSTVFGDVIALADDNEVTEHVFTGAISRHFLRFGSRGQTFVETMSAIHDTPFEGPERVTLDYVGDKTFHTAVYGRPSALASVLGVTASDFIIRPGGHLIMMFGFRKTAEKIDKAGLDLIQASMDVNFY